MSNKKYDDSTRNTAREMYASGLTQKRIGEILGIPEGTIHHFINESICCDNQWKKEWNETRSRLFGLRPGWINEWNEITKKLLEAHNG